MFQENLKMLRKQNGMSQEVLARRLDVVRQTVSKWEKGLSVPDAEMLIRIADLFDTSVGELLGSKIEQKKDIDGLAEVAAQLALLNEQLAKRAKVHRQIIRAVIILIFICIVAAIYPRWNEMWYDFGKNIYYLFNG